jgi:hypothetical protein
LYTLLQKFHTRQLKSQSFLVYSKVIPYVEGKIEPEYFLSLLASMRLALLQYLLQYNMHFTIFWVKTSVIIG